MDKKSIIKILEARRGDLERFSVEEIGLFGSFLHGKQNKKSDIDFLVTLKNPTFDNYMDLKFFLEKILKRKVDLVMKETIKPSLKYVEEEAMYAEVATAIS